MNLKNQRRMAAELFKCGENRVWIDPDRLEDVADAITRADVRIAISSGAIHKLPKVGQSRGRAHKLTLQRSKGRRRGHGSRKGSAEARNPPKARWIRQIRPQRELLRALRDEGRLADGAYRRYYRKARGGMYRSRAHLQQQLEAEGVLGEAKP